MNGNMWSHVATQRNIKQLINDGVELVGPEEQGMLACGYEGAGRMAPVTEIITKVSELTNSPN